MSRGPGKVERRVLAELASRPRGTPLRTLAGIAYAASPGTLTPSQLASVRQVLLRLAGRGTIVSAPGPGGAKLWFHSAATAVRNAEAEDEFRAKAERERKRYWDRQRTRYHQARERWERSSAIPTRAAILDRAAKLMGMMGSMHEGERLAAAQALETLRRRHALDWVDFLTVKS